MRDCDGSCWVRKEMELIPGQTKYGAFSEMNLVRQPSALHQDAAVRPGGGLSRDLDRQTRPLRLQASAKASLLPSDYQALSPFAFPLSPGGLFYIIILSICYIFHPRSRSRPFFV